MILIASLVINSVVGIHHNLTSFNLMSLMSAFGCDEQLFQ